MIATIDHALGDANVPNDLHGLGLETDGRVRLALRLKKKAAIARNCCIVTLAFFLAWIIILLMQKGDLTIKYRGLRAENAKLKESIEVLEASVDDLSDQNISASESMFLGTEMRTVRQGEMFLLDDDVKLIGDKDLPIKYVGCENGQILIEHFLELTPKVPLGGAEGKDTQVIHTFSTVKLHERVAINSGIREWIAEKRVGKYFVRFFNLDIDAPGQPVGYTIQQLTH